MSESGDKDEIEDGPTLDWEDYSRNPDPTTILPERIGTYEILGELGRGGMGVVYVARDPRLRREVALKVLPTGFSRRAGAVERLQHEAQLLASVHHPNIATVFSFEEADGIHFLTMERVEGVSLSTRIMQGPLSIEEALSVARQISSALEEAHARKVIHRDLNPMNIMVGANGVTKVLDFGLAKILSVLPERSTELEDLADPARSPLPGQWRGSIPGVIMGTPGYMSPEQTWAGPVDDRSDIFALGCVIYECLSGCRAFVGKTLWETIVASREREPEWALLRTDVPPAIRDLVMRCLAKDPRDRLQTVREARRIIERELTARRVGQLLDEANWGATNHTHDRIVVLDHSDQERHIRDAKTRSEARHNLPRPVASFVGRERDLAEIDELLKNHPIVTLTGAGGSGKTRLAVEVARASLVGASDRAPASFADGVWIAELSSSTEESDIFQVMANAFGVRKEPEHTISQTVLAFLVGKALLVILDNCEHIVDVCAGVAHQILQQSSRIRTLATSREVLGIAGEIIYEVAPLAVPAEDGQPSVETVFQSAGGRLYVERAQAANPRFALTDDNAGSVAFICRHLDGLPLALELAAARVRMLTVEEIRARLDDRFRLFTSSNRTAVPRHRTLGAVIDWSHDLLSSNEKSLFRRLSIFAGGWTLEAAESICEGDGIGRLEVFDLLARLIDRSLVFCDRDAEERIGAARYRMLETVRQYARAKLDEAQETDGVRQRHLVHFALFAEEVAVKARGPQATRWRLQLDYERGNLHLALDTSLTADALVEPGLRLFGALRRLPPWESNTDVERISAALLARPGAEGHLIPFARVLLRAGDVALSRHQLDRAESLFTSSLEIYSAAKDEAGVAGCKIDLGWLYYSRDSFHRARAFFEAGLDASLRGGDRFRAARALAALGDAARRLGDQAGAREQYEASLACLWEFSDPEAATAVLSNWAMMTHAEPDRTALKRIVEENLDLSRRLGDPGAIAASSQLLSRFFQRENDLERASECLEESLSIFRRLGWRRDLAMVLQELGTIALMREQYVHAWVQFEESRRICVDLEMEDGFASALGSLGDLWYFQEEYFQAREFYERSLTLRRRAGHPRLLMHSLLRIVRVLLEEKNCDEARKLLGEALATCVPYREPWTNAFPLVVSGMLAHAEGNFTAATHLLAAGSRLYDEAGTLRHPQEERRFVALVNDLRSELGDEEFVRQWDEGTSMTIEGALRMADQRLDH